MLSRDDRVNLLIGTGHFLSHFYQLCLPPLFLVWQAQFNVTFAELGVAVVLMTATAAVLQTPVGFLVDRFGARPFLIGGTLTMSLAILAMGFATAFWQILALSLVSGIGNWVGNCEYRLERRDIGGRERPCVVCEGIVIESHYEPVAPVSA